MELLAGDPQEGAAWGWHFLHASLLPVDRDPSCHLPFQVRPALFYAGLLEVRGLQASPLCGDVRGDCAPQTQTVPSGA